jgi:hypothetical protein
VRLAGNANQIADMVRSGSDGWEPLADGVAAAMAAADRLVIAGLRGDTQAHRTEQDRDKVAYAAHSIP